MKPIKVAEGIFSVGAVDWNIRDFHGYSTFEGTTYNAYLILDEKVVLIDTVKKAFADDLIEHIGKIVDPKRIDYVVSNHTEMDHSGALPRVMHRIGEDKPIFCSRMGHKNLAKHFRAALNFRPVSDGEELPLGKRTLKFLETRMVHWPDSMFTYEKEGKILFSSDGFGQHYAGQQHFDDELGEEVMVHAKKYYANILLLYAPMIQKLLEKVQAMELAVELICPDHGVIWRKDPWKIIEAYGQWSEQRPSRKAVVVYDTMWHSTERMAEAIVDSLGEEGVAAVPYHLRKWHRSEIMTEVLDAGAVLVGSPTLNNGLFPTVADFLAYMKGLKPRNKVGAAFGSYGWSGEAVKLITKELEEAKFEVVDSGLKVQYVPDQEALAACEELGKKIAKALPES